MPLSDHLYSIATPRPRVPTAPKIDRQPQPLPLFPEAHEKTVVRRKGEKPVIHQPLLWTENCTIAHMIRTGNRWLFAWMMQQCVQMKKLSKQSGIPTARLDDLWRGDEATEGELEGLAGPFRTDVASLRASIAFATAPPV